MAAEESESGGRARWTAIVLAGQRPGRDPLAENFGGMFKALVPIDGQAMVARVVALLLSMDEIERVLLLGLPRDITLPHELDWLRTHPRIAWGESEGGISTTVLAALSPADTLWPVLVTTADHPLLDTAIVREFLEGSSRAALSVGVVRRRTILAHYPGNRRTYLKFRDGAFSGANLFALRDASVFPALRFWAEAEADRKKAWKLFRRFGPWLALRAMTRSISAGAAIRRAGRRLGVDAAFVELSAAEAAIDVDKLSDFRLAEQILRRRAEQAAATISSTGGPPLADPTD